MAIAKFGVDLGLTTQTFSHRAYNAHCHWQLSLPFLPAAWTPASAQMSYRDLACSQLPGNCEHIFL
jgi:hypothetical protein